MADSIDEYYELCEFCDYDIRLTAKLVYREFKKDWIIKKAGSDNRQRELFTKLYKLRYKESRIIEDMENLRVEKYKITISRLLDGDAKILLEIKKSILQQIENAKGLFNGTTSKT